ncbi:unnamed protein product [Clavelina lepadiformis]|uniref:C-type lectin domain-containing protein n=1 Tax=Clavelina lepadiformis TaxID=159417 RepID=A0ABP0G0Z7_CLALP
MLIIIICMFLFSASLSSGQDYATCTVPDTTIINQLLRRVVALEQALQRNATERVASLEMQLHDTISKLNNLTAEKNSLTTLLETMKEDLERVSRKQQAALNRERALHDPDWHTPFNGYQYRLTPLTQSWQASRTVCQDMHSDLAVIGVQNPTTRRSLANTLGLENTWIGLNDLSREGAWEWIDGTKTTHDNTQWFPGEPSNSGNQDCGEIWGHNFQYKTNDDDCTKLQKGLCERRLLPPK